jgi:L-seryl-tRNA(Ser) seleniumtransferase
LAAAFRALPVPVIGRVKDGAFIMDLRCLEHEDEFLGQLTQLKIDVSLDAKPQSRKD